ncbi:hypothetical protein VPH35_012471 [Triticum aestivum]
MATEPLRDNLDTVAATDQPYDGDSSSQQQLAVYNYDLRDPHSTVLSPANQESTCVLGGVTSPGLCRVNSSLGQTQFQIATGGSPEHRRIRSNDALHYISHMLMDDVDERVDICQGEAALQAAEKPFRDILGEVYAPATNCPPMHSNNKPENPDKSGTSSYKRLWSTSFSNNCSSYSVLQPLTNLLSPYTCNRSLSLNSPSISVGPTSRSSFPAFHCQRDVEEATMFAPRIGKLVIYLENDILSISKLTIKETVGQRSENWDILEARSNKHLVFTTCAITRNENFDRVLLCYGRKTFDQTTRLQETMAEKGNNNSVKGRSKGRQKLRARMQPRKELVDLRTLLIHCAQAVAEDSYLLASELLLKIRQHSSADGDCTERLAFYLADGLEARLAGSGSQVYRTLIERRTSPTDWLEAYSLFVAACPFVRTSYYFASQAILDVSKGQQRVHIIDFGIGYGFQWPLMIQKFAQQEEGAPKLRITGIDVSQPGFRPCEMIEETGKRLADYANMFKVPFQYQGIAAARWDTIKIEDLNIDEDEVLIINCIFRMKNLGHETDGINSARDEVLKTMRRMNPKVFISGTVNVLHSSPFFIQRFKEVMLHYSSVFDMLDANVPWDNEARKMLERIPFGRDALNIIACEDAERTQRPESYRQWQARCLKAGFQQLPVDQAILKNIVHMKNLHYHEEFFSVEDCGWLLQGWKGRVMYAISKWKPDEKYDGQFAKVIVRVFGPEYLRAPNEDDTKKLMAANEMRGWPGMLGSIDCMHWNWKNCPKAWQGMYCGKSRDATIVLEAVASEDLWIWHCFFGMPGTLNDINVLQHSHLFARLASGDAPACNYTINGHEYTKEYYLADGTYPPWCTFVESIKEPKTKKQCEFARVQEAARKDIERAFGVLQSRFAIVRGPARFWDKKTLKNIITCCVILHNMILKDERGMDLELLRQCG